MPEKVVFAIDVVLGLLVGPPGCYAESVLPRIESGEWIPVVPDGALYCAFLSIRPTDRVNRSRLTRLLKHAEFIRLSGRAPAEPHPTPTEDEIAHWRSVVFGG
jgi:hypothetical protein